MQSEVTMHTMPQVKSTISRLHRHSESRNDAANDYPSENAKLSVPMHEIIV
jgi:hypothetical protein